jgi:thiosulfate/3-mercaptopyruvate sulfurtransferase
MPAAEQAMDTAAMPSLIEPAELLPLLGSGDLVLMDTRDVSAFKRAHLPGAFSCEDIFYYLCLPENGGLTGLAEFFTRMFAEAGIRPESRVVFYEHAMDNGYGRSCRGWMLANYLGHARVQVLHGGFQAWSVLGLPVTGEVVTPQPYPFAAVVTPGQIIGQAEMFARLNQENMVLVDCRDYAEWLGANSSPYGYDYCPRKGRIPGSVWLEWYRLMEHRGGAAWFRSAEEISRLCAEGGITPDKKVIVYCFKGARASAVVMALRRSGFPDVVNYLASWNEWSRDLTLPADEEYPNDIA